MTDLRDHAESAKTEIVRISEAAPQSMRIEDEELVDAEEIGTEEFPQYGEFLKVTRHPDSDLTVYVECPAAMADAIVEQVAHNADLDGRWVVLDDVEKIDGRWTVDLDVAEAGATLDDVRE